MRRCKADYSEGVVYRTACGLKPEPRPSFERVCAGVQVKSDYSDLEAVVKNLLGDPDRMQRIADAAYQRLLSHASVRGITVSPLAPCLYQVACITLLMPPVSGCCPMPRCLYSLISSNPS